MKSFFKKLSVVVLAAAMVLALVPAMNSTAAALTLGESKTTAKQSYDLKVGESIDLNFYGASNYVEKNDGKSVAWKSSDTKVVSVDDKGVIKALKAGTATITASCTVSATKQSYTGSVKVTVREVAKGYTATLTKYLGNNKATFELQFADEATAKANEKNVTVTRVRVTKVKRLDLITKVDSVKVDGSKLIVTFGASDGVTYCINVAGIGSVDKVVSAGKPVDAFISCDDVVVATKDDKDPRVSTGKPSTSGTSNLKCEIIDENGVVIAEFEGKNGVNVNAKLSGAGITYKNVEKNINITSKTVTLSKQGDKAVVKGEFTCKVGTENIKLATNEITVKTVNYQYPTGLDFAYDVHTVDIDAKKKDIKFDEDCTFTASMNVRDSKQIVYVFKATDVNNNTGFYTGNGAYAAYKDGDKELKGLSSKFVFALDPEADHVVVLDNANGKITAVKGGTEYVFIYTDSKDNPELVGYLEVTVNAEPVLSEIVLSENYLLGYNNAEANTAKQEITVELFDQNGDAIAFGKTRGVTFSKGELSSAIYVKDAESDATKKATKVTLVVDFSQLTPTQDAEALTFDVEFKNSEGKKVVSELTLDTYMLADDDEQGFAIVANDVTINNKAIYEFAKNPTTKNPNPVIKVMKSLGGINKAIVDTYWLPELTAAQKDAEENPIVDLPNFVEYLTSEDAVKKGIALKNGCIYLAISKDGKQVYKDCNGSFNASATASARTFAVTKNDLGDASGIMAGTYVVDGWYVSDNSYEQLQSVEFTVTKDVKGLAELTTNKVENLKATSTQAYEADATGTVKQLLTAIIGSFSGKYDLNQDGEIKAGEFDKLNSTATEMKKFVDSVEITRDEYILASDGKTIFIKSFTLNYNVNGVKSSESWQINKSFVTKGYSGEAVDFTKTSDDKEIRF